MNDWLIVMVFVLGWVQGLWVGWYIWRRPTYTIPERKNEPTN
jgi:uncharacterized protein YneF (UPF0154 family)